MKKILLIATGGTIASKYTEQGLSPQISANELLEYVPAARDSVRSIRKRRFLSTVRMCVRNTGLHWRN